MRSIDDAIIRPTAPSVLPGGAEDGTEKEKEEKEKQEELSWWEWITHKADEVQGWVDDFIKSHVPGQQQGEGEGEKKDD